VVTANQDADRLLSAGSILKEAYYAFDYPVAAGRAHSDRYSDCPSQPLTPKQTKARRSMNKSALRVTKWLGDIPVEACCTLCPSTLFRAASTHHRPQKAEYQEQLQRAFDRHVRDAHTGEGPGLPAE
jgi:hypothetical protein